MRSAAYRAIATWDGDGDEWRLEARTADNHDLHCEFTASRRLQQAHGRARAFLSRTGQPADTDVVDVVVEGQLPNPDDELRLHVAEDLVADASGEVDSAVARHRTCELSPPR